MDAIGLPGNHEPFLKMLQEFASKDIVAVV